MFSKTECVLENGKLLVIITGTSLCFKLSLITGHDDDDDVIDDDGRLMLNFFFEKNQGPLSVATNRASLLPRQLDELRMRRARLFRACFLTVSTKKFPSNQLKRKFLFILSLFFFLISF